ncbi:hypothetical protein AMECASPLE_031891 [Ameca splendens]|uniref:Uncharacterized protein n=1 Tax=Ameca splendens TaxID=208324 RepID=A0ABV1AEX1_9TELE
MQNIFEGKKFVERTLEKHIRQCKEIDRACTDTLKASLRTTYGINRKSHLLDVPAFDLIRQTPQDIMHFILECVAPMKIKLILKLLILPGLMELNEVNAAIQNVPYPPLDIQYEISLAL